MNVSQVVALVALVSVALNVLMILREVKHRSLVADVLTTLADIRNTVTIDANRAKAKVDAAINALKAKL